MTKQTVWVNIYHELRGAAGSAHATREAADMWSQGRVACVEVNYEPGEGLGNANVQDKREG